MKKLEDRDFEEFSDQAATVHANAQGRLGEKLAFVLKIEEQAAEMKRLKAIEEDYAKLKKQQEIAAVEAPAPAVNNSTDENIAPPEVSPADFLSDSEPAGAPDVAKKAAALLGGVPFASDAPASAPAPSADDKAVKAKINNAIVGALEDECMLSKSTALAVTKALVKGLIPNVTVNY